MSEFLQSPSPVLVEIKVEPYEVLQHDPPVAIKTEPGGAPARVACKVEPEAVGASRRGPDEGTTELQLRVVKKEPQSDIKNEESCGDGCQELDERSTIKGKQRNRPAQGPTQFDKVKENEDIKEKKRRRNQEYQRAWRQRQRLKDLKINGMKKKYLKKKKEEEKRKRHRESQRAYYQRTKLLKENYKNGGELFQKKLDDLPMKREKLDSDDQENVQLASQDLENVQLVQCLGLYKDSHKCASPRVILHRNTDIPGDGNCLFLSLIHVLKLPITVCGLRRQLRDSPHLNSCRNPQVAYNILSSNTEYGDLDCLYLFTKVYNQNICVHYHYVNVTSNDEDTRFCHFKVNESQNWVHLDLREHHFTPYISDYEKIKDNERRQKQKNKEYSKRYRDRKRISKLQRVHTQAAGPSTNVPYAPSLVLSSQIADISSLTHSNYNSIEDRCHRHFPPQVASSLNTDQPHSACQQNSSAHQTLEICREDVPDDREEMKDVFGKIPDENPLAESHYNPNADLNDDSLFDKLGADEKTTESKTSLVGIKSEPAVSVLEVKMESSASSEALHTGLPTDVVIKMEPQSGAENITIKKEESCESSQLLGAGSFNVFDMEFSVKEEGPVRPALSAEVMPQETGVTEDTTSNHKLGGEIPTQSAGKTKGKRAQGGASTVTVLKPHQCDVCQRRFKRASDLANHHMTHTGEKPFQCHVCQHLCNRKVNLLRHLKSHTGERPFQCEQCPKAYREKASLMKHLRSHAGVKPFQCDYCQKAFGDRRYLLQHIRKHTGGEPRRAQTEDKPYLCTECGSQFDKHCDFLRHMRNHSGDGENTFQCDVCQKWFDHRLKLLQHIRNHNKKKNYQCELCQKSFYSRDDWSSHVRTHTGERPFQCEVCPLNFTHKRYLLQHIQTHSGEKPYKCEICQRAYNLKQTLAQHIKSHSNEKPFHCNVCQYKFKVKRSLIEHVRTHTGEKPYQCELCEQSFRLRRLLIQHVRSHTGEKPYQCDICQFQCSVKQTILYHMRIHTGEKPFQCELCQQRFIRKQTLTLHMRTHTSEKLFQCQVCQKGFNTKPVLAVHMRTHTGEKPFACDVCPKTFSQKNNLLIHSRTHTGDKRFQCEVCQKAFVRKDQLTRHMRSHRGEKPSQ